MSEGRAPVRAVSSSTGSEHSSPNTHRSSLIAQHLRAVLFDLEGTLVDSVESIVRSFTHATQSLLGTTVPREAIVATIGRPLAPIFEALAPGRGAELLQTYRAYLNEHHDALVRAFPGTFDLLAARAAGMACAAVTWGAGTLADLEAQAPDVIVHEPAELLAHCPPRV